MAVRFPTLEFVDEHGGLADLAARVLHTPSAPEESFADDPLRMLRAARFASQLGFTVATDVQAAMTASAESLSMVSAERIREELTKLLMSDSPRAGLTLLVDTGLAEVVPAGAARAAARGRRAPPPQGRLPALADRAGAGDPARGPLMPDVSAAETVPGPRPRAPARRAAARRGQAGDPAVRARRRRLVPPPRGGRRQAGAKRLKALRYDKETIAAVAQLVELHLRFHGYGTGSGPTRPSAATSPTRARCCRGCTC